MVILNEIVTDNAILALWEITETKEELLDLLDNDPIISAQIKQFGSKKRQLEFLATRALLNSVLGETKTIAYEANGKPYLTDRSYSISITHTGNYAAILLHPTAAVGIDIEKISEKVERVKTRFLSEMEQSYVDVRTEKTQLTLMWAAKEALYKIIGKEKVDFVADLHIDVFHPYLEGTMEARETCSKQPTDYIIHYRVFPEFVLVWIVK